MGDLVKGYWDDALWSHNETLNYTCLKCNHTWKIQQKPNFPVKVDICPVCNSKNVNLDSYGVK